MAMVFMLLLFEGLLAVSFWLYDGVWRRLLIVLGMVFAAIAIPYRFLRDIRSSVRDAESRLFPDTSDSEEGGPKAN